MPAASSDLPPINAAVIRQRIEQVRAEIPPHVEIMAVSKGYSTDHIRAAYDAGIRHFGESRVQEAKPKIAALQDHPDIIWHLIGHLQTNKVKPAVSLFDWIDSVDSWKLAQAIHQAAWDLNKIPRLCLQVKLAADPQKYGWSVPELLQNLPRLPQLSHVKIQGLMTILPLDLSADQALDLFQKLANLSHQIEAIGYDPIEMKVLSMGMSADYPLAVAAGATIIRLGRFLFADEPLLLQPSLLRGTN